MSGKKITPLDETVYEFVLRFTRLHHHPPDSLAVVARGIGAREASVLGSVRRLVELGILEREVRYNAPVLIVGSLFEESEGREDA